VPFVRRRPLLRAAAVGGVAQTAQAAPTQPAPAPTAAPAPAASPAGDDTISRLQQLASLHDSGALTDEEFTAAKAQVLG
jgi:hypothetical protein